MWFPFAQFLPKERKVIQCTGVKAQTHFGEVTNVLNAHTSIQLDVNNYTDQPDNKIDE